MIRRTKYLILGGIVGMIIGVFGGLIFGVAQTKKSQIFLNQTMQAVVFGGIGIILGGSFGIKIALEEDEKERKEKVYLDSLLNVICKHCSTEFTYSTLHRSIPKIYCDSCDNKVSTVCIPIQNEIIKLLDEFDELKRKDAKLKRLNRAEELVDKILVFEEIETLSIKPSELVAEIQKRKITLNFN